MNIGLIEGPSGVRSEGSGPVGNPALLIEWKAAMADTKLH